MWRMRRIGRIYWCGSYRDTGNLADCQHLQRRHRVCGVPAGFHNYSGRVSGLCFIGRPAAFRRAAGRPGYIYNEMGLYFPDLFACCSAAAREQTGFFYGRAQRHIYGYGSHCGSNGIDRGGSYVPCQGEFRRWFA